MSNEIQADYCMRFILPPAIEDWVPRDHIARFICAVVDKLDLKGLGFKERKSEEGRPNYSSSLLLKIWLYGYLENIYSTRALEKSCTKEMPLIWLTGMNYPDHNTLWRFFKSHQEAIKKVFVQSVKLAVKGGMVSLALQAVDGTKIAADVNKNKTVYLSDLKKLLSALESSVDEVLEKIAGKEASEVDAASYTLPIEYQDKRALNRLIEKGLEELSPDKRQELSRGIQSEIKKLEDAGANQLNLTDRDARQMKKADGKTSFCYNAQAVVDSKSQIIVGALVSGDATDNHLLTSMIDESAQNTGKVCGETLADGGYFSGEELQAAVNKGYEVLVNMRDEIKGTSGNRETVTGEEGNVSRFEKASFFYDQEKDVYICPAKQELKFEQEKLNSSKTYLVRTYRCHNHTCPYKDQCSKQKRGRGIERSQYETALAAQIQRHGSSENRALLRKRKHIVEPVFGWIKSNNKFTRWLYRGLKSVEAQWMIICTAVNLKKIFKSWQAGTLLFEISV